MEINIHKVTKIEVRNHDLTNFSTKDFIIHSTQYDIEKGRDVTTKFTVNCFLENEESGNLVETSI